MAAGKACFCVFAIAALLLILDLSAPVYAEGISLGQLQVLHKDRHLLSINCGKACEGRCAAAGRKNRCLRFCGICCSKCNCVPPGTYGNKDACPCYRDLKNDRGTSKCP